MARHTWRLPVAAWLCGSLLPACAAMSAPGTAGPATAAAPVGADPPLAADHPPASRALVQEPAGPAEAPQPMQPPKPVPAREAPPAIGLGAPRELEPAAYVVSTPVPAVAAKPAEEPALVQAVRCFLDKRPEDALARLKGYAAPNQEMLLSLLPLAIRLTEGSLDQASPQETAVILDECNSALAPLRSRAPLTIDAMCFCRRIKAFGVYDPFEPDHAFQPGDQVDLYVEVGNFTSKAVKHPAGPVTHVIDLASSAEIRDYAGNKVWPRRIVFGRQALDESRTPRRDYFDHYRFAVPDVAPGAYVLWIDVEDRGTSPPRKARRSLDFHVTHLPVHGS
jgi:hypothetical protein